MQGVGIRQRGILFANPFANAMKADSRWIVNPLVDLLFCCGGLMWLLFAADAFIARPLSNPTTQMLALVTLLGTHAFAEPHISATLFRVFRTKESRKQYSFYTVGGAIAAAIACGACLLVPGVLGVLLKVYLLWVVYHYTGQAYGLVLLYCLKNRFYLRKTEKMTLSALLNCGAAVSVVRQLTLADFSPTKLLGQDIPFWGPLPQFILQGVTLSLVAVTFLFTIQICLRLARSGQAFPLPALMIILTTVALFTASSEYASVLWIYAPAFFHATQYLALTMAMHLKELLSNERKDPAQFHSIFFKEEAMGYIGTLFVIAMCLYVGLPTLLSFFGIKYAVAFLTIFCVSSLHHFATDSAIWKLRDPKLRSLVLN